MTVSFTVNVAWPFASVVPLTVVIVELPLPAASDTVLPLTAVPTLSLSVTVMVDVVEPSAATDVGLALTVDVLALTGPTTVNDADTLLPVAFCWVATTVCAPGLLDGTRKLQVPEILLPLLVEQVATSVPFVVLRVPSQ